MINLQRYKASIAYERAAQSDGIILLHYMYGWGNSTFVISMASSPFPDGVKVGFRVVNVNAVFLKV